MGSWPPPIQPTSKIVRRGGRKGCAALATSRLSAMVLTISPQWSRAMVVIRKPSWDGVLEGPCPTYGGSGPTGGIGGAGEGGHELILDGLRRVLRRFSPFPIWLALRCIARPPGHGTRSRSRWAMGAAPALGTCEPPCKLAIPLASIDRRYDPTTGKRCARLSWGACRAEFLLT
jgi:hypothetical protein